MKINPYFVILSVLLLPFSCLQLQTQTQTQTPAYKKVGNIPAYVDRADAKVAQEKALQSTAFVDATKYFPQGFSFKGDIDCTPYLQKALNENRRLTLPNFPLVISDLGLDIPDNTTVVFATRSVIMLMPSNKPIYQILRVHNKSNVSIIAPKIIGDRKHHTGSGGEWGMGISVVSSNNVSITNVDIKDCWGDGIYLGQNRLPNKNVTVKYGVIDNNRRNGISIISSDGLLISDLVISNTNGTNPQAAIDVEPNKPNEPVKNTVIKNIYSFNNKNNGLSIVLNQQNKTTDPIQLTVENFKDRHAINGIFFMNLGTETKGPLSGNIHLDNIATDNNINKFRFYKGSSLGNIKFTLKPAKGYSYTGLEANGIIVLN